MPNQVRVGVGVTGAKQAETELDRFRDKFDKLQKQSAKGLAIGAGAGIAVAGLNLVGGAVHEVTNLLGDSIHAAMEEELSIGKLTTSLKANVAGWDGNTSAIERVIKSRVALAFSDEEQRDALAKTVAATHDVSEALRVQRVAMDLARFKGISLAEATDGLTKVEAGSYRILKSLGIVLKEGATQTEALAAVEKVAAGQAEDFANKNAGKLLRSQIAVNESMEKFGNVIMPIVATGADYVTNVLDGTSVAFDQLKKDAESGSSGARLALARLTQEAQRNGLSVEDLYAEWQARGGDIAAVAADMAKHVGDHVGKMADDMATATRKIGDDGQKIGGYVELIGRKAGTAEDQLAAAMDGMVKDIKGARSELESAASSAADAIYDPIIAKAHLATNKRDREEQAQIIASKKSTAAQVADAKLRMDELDKDQMNLLATLASFGDKSAAITLNHMIDARIASHKLTSEQRAELEKLRIKLDEVGTAADNARKDLKRLAHQAILTKDDLYIPVVSVGGGGGGGRHRAAGGPVSPGQAYTVGENGPESLVMGSGSGTVIANGGASSNGGSSSGPIVVAVPANWTPGQQQAFAREAAPHIARELQRQGLI